MGPAPRVGLAFFPLDEQLALQAGSLTPQVLEWVVRLATWMPFERAVQLLQAITKVQVSPETARRQTEQAGKLIEQEQDAESRRLMDVRQNVSASPQEAAPRQVWSADGAMVPLVHGQWGEVKLLVLAEQVPNDEGEMHLEQLSYYARMASAQDFADLSVVETRRRRLEEAKDVAALSDGAVWLQGMIEVQCPHAVRILDFPHAAQRLGESAQEVRAAGLSLPQDWLGQQLHQLKHEGPNCLLATLRRWQQRFPKLEKVAENLAYLSKREAHMQYPQYQAQGWPIGSGMVESGHKQVMQVRLKGAGMHWEPRHVNPMLALRTGVCNDRWDEVWSQRTQAVLRGKQQQRVARTRQRLQAARRELLTLLAHREGSAPAPPPQAIAAKAPASPVKGPPRPAATHPWRRRLLAYKPKG